MSGCGNRAKARRYHARERMGNPNSEQNAKAEGGASQNPADTVIL
jgi:hypothetical protein